VIYDLAVLDGVAHESHRCVTMSGAEQDRATKDQENGPFGRPVLTFLVLALPALVIGWLIYCYGVDTPWGDEWDSTVPLLEKMQAGTLRWADFFAFHNEHRIFFPRLLTFGLARLTDWNVRAELLIIWLLACTCSFNLWQMMLVTNWRHSRTRDWLLLGSNILLFAPCQWENLLWGFQIGFFLPLAALTACFWAAPALRRPFDFLATMALCLVCTFSIASGFVSWLLTAPLLLLWQRKLPARGEKIWWLTWLLVGTVSIVLYFRGYAQPAIHPSAWEAWKHPLRAIQFILAYLGTPFSGAAPDPSSWALVASSALVILFAACLMYLWRWRRDNALLAPALPWVSLAGSAVVNAFLTMLGRLGFGVFAATQSRYVSFAIMLPIGLLFLTSLVFAHWRKRFNRAGGKLGLGRGLVVLVIALSLLFVGGSIKSLESWQRFQHARLSGKADLLVINLVDESGALARHVHQGDAALKARANFLDGLGYLRPRLLRSKGIREIAFRPRTEKLGELEELGKTATGVFEASGWAILPDSHRVADGVLLTYDDAQGEPTIFALAEVRHQRDEVSRQLNDQAYVRCGWTKAWKEGQIPADAKWIRAWAFDAENGGAFPIGAAMLQPPTVAP
jgi:hypothetical protein